MKFSQLIESLSGSKKTVIDKFDPRSASKLTTDDTDVIVSRLQKGDVIYTDEEGLLHNDNGPALVSKSEGQSWYKHGKRHRDGGPARRTNNGRISYYKDGMLHREDGPAIIDNVFGSETYYMNGKIHRADGPAFINGSTGTEDYYINGKRTAKEEFDRITKIVDKDNLQDVADIGDLF